MKKKLFLIDAFGQIFRAYFAFMGKPLLSPEGKNLNAYFGFFKILFQLIRDRKPTHLAVVYDSRTPTFREEIYPAYKEHRDAAPEDLLAQLPDIEETLGAIGLPTLQKDGFEADDLLATAAKWCREQDAECWVVSSDKDLLQTVAGSVRVLKIDPRGGWKEMGPDQVLEDRGVRPDQIVDYLSLVGDSSDNVPGVAGIGDKTAVKLLTEFDNLDRLYSEIDKIPSESQKKKLLEGKESAYLSRRLVVLRDDVEIPLDWDNFEIKYNDPRQATALFLKKNAKGLAQDLQGLTGEFALDGGGSQKPEPQALQGHYEMILTEGELDRWIAKLKNLGEGAFDLETSSLDTFTCDIAGIAFSCEAGVGAYVPLKAPNIQCLPEELVLGKLRYFFEDPAFRLVGQNFKFDAKVLAARGIAVRSLYFDTMTAAWVLDTNGGQYGLEVLALNYLGLRGISYESLVPKGKSITQIDPAEVAKYASEDADFTWRLYQVLKEKLRKEGFDKLFYEMEMPLLPLLWTMELEGIGLKKEELQAYSVELEASIKGVQKEIWDLCGEEFNLGSPKQLQEILFVKRQLTPPPRAKIKTGFSTDSDILEELALEDPVPGKILRYRALTKLKSTYVDTLPLLVNPQTGRIHTHFLPTGTATGRLSSKDPNLQNIPIREEEGRRIRRAFVPRPGWTFVSADYSQIELVILAHLSGDKNLCSAFREGRDIHRSTASLMFQMFEEMITPEQRRAAKAINFGIMYGMSAFRLAGELKISRKEASAFMEAYQREFSGIKGYFDKVIRDAETTGEVTTMFGRRRKVVNILGRNRVEKQAAERIAMNTPIQGSAADLVKMAMIRVDARIKKEQLRAKLILQVHDELILEVPQDEVELVKTILKEEMESVTALSVPLRIGLETGATWGELH